MNFVARASAALVLSLAMAAPAHAGGEEVGAFLGGLFLGGAIGRATAPAYGGTVYVTPAPIYVEPAPIYVEPRPVYVRPRPVYVRPAPVYVEPAPVYVERGYSDHQLWCMQRYRSYNPRTDVYFVRQGVPAYCVSPYS